MSNETTTTTEAPDWVTDEGVPVWRDISDLRLPCDLAAEATDYPDRPYVCAGTAERRIGHYHACNYHFERAHAWAADEAREAAADSEAAARFEENYR